VCLLYWLLASFLFSLQFLKAVFYLLIKFAHIFPSFFSSEMEKWQFQVNLILKSIEILSVYWKEHTLYSLQSKVSLYFQGQQHWLVLSIQCLYLHANYLVLDFFNF